MKKILLLAIAIIAFANVHAQQKDSLEIINGSDSSFNGTPAEFPGGYAGWNKYLQQNLNADLGAKYVKVPKGKKIGTASVIVSFTISPDGAISDVKAEKGEKVHPKLTREAIRVVKEGPKWTPAILDGEKVIFRHRQTINWQVSEE